MPWFFILISIIANSLADSKELLNNEAKLAQNCGFRAKICGTECSSLSKLKCQCGSEIHIPRSKYTNSKSIAAII